MARKTSRRKKSATPAPQPAPKRSRRDVLRGFAVYGIGAAVLIGGGTAFAMDFRSKLAEQDLSVIGNGTPTVVQIHDPTCDLCAQLQTQARKAARTFDDDALNFRVANIATEGGLALQSREGLGHVTLVLYDGSGRRVHVIEGVTPAADLADQYAQHLGLSGA